MKLSVTIVAYEDEKDVRKAVSSIMKYMPTTIDVKIYIVDNSITSNNLCGLEQEYPQVIYKKMPKNVGFGRGHNAVIDELDSDYHAIVNPDIVCKSDCFTPIIEFLEKKESGVVIPRLIYEDGELQQVYRRELTVLDMVIRRHLSGLFHRRQDYHTMQDMDYTKDFQVPFAQGSFLVMNTSLFKELRGFDENYFLYVEDADFCKRINEISSIWYIPNATVVHRWKKGSHRSFKLRMHHIKSAFYYFNKWGWKLW